MSTTKSILVLCAGVLLAQLSVPPAPAQEMLTNDSILAMKKAGLALSGSR